MDNNKNNECSTSITFLNTTGDITLEWKKRDNDTMIQMMQEKIDQGFTVFLVEKKMFGIVSDTIKVNDPEDIDKLVNYCNIRKAVIQDPAVEEAVGCCKEVVKVVKNKTKNATTQVVKVVEDAKEIIGKQAVVTAPVRVN